MKCSTKNIVNELPHELPMDLRLRILRNTEIMGKTQKRVEEEPSTQYPFQRKSFGTDGQNYKITQQQISKFLVVSNID